MAPAFILFLFIGLVLLVRNANPSGNRNALLKSGVYARGLILQASSMSTEAGYGGQRFESRRVTLDVEVPGQAPYEVSVVSLFPRICEATPGAALDLRVDPKNRQRIAILGPAGSSGWLNVAATMPGQTWAGTQAFGAAQKGCSTAIVAIIGAGLAIASFFSFASGGSHSSSSRPPAIHSPPSSEVAVIGGSCSGDEVACTPDHQSYLRCKTKAFRVAGTCRGPKGCRSDGRTVGHTSLDCDTDVAAEGDPCEKDKTSCSVDRRDQLACDGKRFQERWSCKGPKGCTVTLDTTLHTTTWNCDSSIADVGDPCKEGAMGCSGNFRQVLECRAGRFATSKTCSRGCVIKSPTEVGCAAAPSMGH